MRYILLLLLLAGGWLHAQTGPVSNVNLRVSEDRDMVTITYDLARNSRIPFYDIRVQLTLGGRPIAKPAGLSGDLGPQVAAGLGKKIIWDTKQDVTALEGELKVDVTTASLSTDNAGGPCAPIRTVPVLAGLGGVAVTGLGLLVGGLGQKGEGDELYAVYRDNTDPSAAVYNSLSRDEHYQEANGKHKGGSWLAAGGGAVLVAGGAVLVTRLLKIGAYNKRCREGMTATLPEPRLRLEAASAGGPGVAVVYRFGR